MSADRSVLDSGVKFNVAQKVFSDESRHDFEALSSVPHCSSCRFYGHLLADEHGGDNIPKIQFHARHE